jgi:hypothetical protein
MFVGVATCELGTPYDNVTIFKELGDDIKRLIAEQLVSARGMVTVLVVAVVEISARKTQKVAGAREAPRVAGAKEVPRVAEAKEAQKVGEVREARKHTDFP